MSTCWVAERSRAGLQAGSEQWWCGAAEAGGTLPMVRRTTKRRTLRCQMGTKCRQGTAVSIWHSATKVTPSDLKSQFVISNADLRKWKAGRASRNT